MVVGRSPAHLWESTMYLPVTLELDYLAGPAPNQLASKLKLTGPDGTVYYELDLAAVAAGQTLNYGPLYVEILLPQAPQVAKTAATVAPKTPGTPPRR